MYALTECETLACYTIGFFPSVEAAERHARIHRINSYSIWWTPKPRR